MFAVCGGFLSILEKMARSTPIIPLIGGGRTRLQPVHVEGAAPLIGALRDVKIAAVLPNSLRGVLVNAPAEKALAL